jgi:phosphatidylglycerophosphate synthase
MIETAVIISGKSNAKLNKTIYGLSPLERNLCVLKGAGIKRIILKLADEEKKLYNKKIKSRIKRLRGIEIIEDNESKYGSGYLMIQSNLFMQTHYFSRFNEYFKKDKDKFIPVLKDDLFLLADKSDFQKAAYLAKKNILDNTDGYIARNINKKISIPMSALISKTGVHPNVLSIFNLIIGIMSGVFLLGGTYWYTVLGGTFFQLASVLDGVDGEVAKFTFKTSKIGSWLDTIVDNSTLFLFLGAASYLYYLQYGGLSSLVLIAVLFAGAITMILTMFSYLTRFSESRSLVAYDKEFIQKLPQNDPCIIIIRNLKYITKKDFFSLFFWGMAFTGKIYYLIPVVSVCIVAASIILIIVNTRYLKNFRK